MSRLVLVRHGHAAAGWGDDPDPGLDDRGRAQAAALADALEPIGPQPVVVSGLRRCRETAAALCTRWGIEPIVEARVEEIPTPAGLDLGTRSGWLREVMSGVWSNQTPELRGWRDAIVDCLLGIRADTVVVSHFVAINVALGRATDDDRVMCFRPDNCSRTVLENDGASLRLVEPGAEARTEVR